MYLRFRLRALMRERGLRERDLWLRTGIARNTIRALERNASTRVDLGTLERLAAGLGVRPLELLEETEQPQGDRRLAASPTA